MRARSEYMDQTEIIPSLSLFEMSPCLMFLILFVYLSLSAEVADAVQLKLKSNRVVRVYGHVNSARVRLF
jgi:hypothetical protein